MMKRFALLLLMAGTVVAQITDFEKCQQRACYGYGPPSGTSQNGMIYQDLKETPPKLYCGQGGSWQICGSSGGTNVPATPQFRIFIQPDPGTVSSIGPASTSQDAVTPLLQGFGRTSSYSTGNNGISNFFSQFPTGYAKVPPNDVSTEAVGIPNTGAAIEDYRNNALLRSGHNNTSTRFCAPRLANTPFAFCETNDFDLSLQNHIRSFGYYNSHSRGFNLGASGFSGQADSWTVRQADLLEMDGQTRGIQQIKAWFLHKQGIGDSGDYGYHDCKGGSTDSAAEGCVSLYRAIVENQVYFHGNISAGGTGATSVTTSFTGGDPKTSDGGFLLNISKGTLSGAETSVSFPVPKSGGTAFMAMNFSAGTFPVSTACGIGQADTDSSANGQYQISVPQSLNVAACDAIPASFANGKACIVGKYDPAISSFSEQTTIAGIGTGSPTFTTRYAYKAGFLVMQGGMCGQYATPTNSSAWRTGVLAVGSLSPTQVITTACSHGSCTADAVQESAWNLLTKVILNRDTNISFFPGAEIIAPNNGGNTIPLEPNNVVWANGDAVENPNPASVNVTGQHIVAGQTTPNNDIESIASVIDWLGPTRINQLQYMNMDGPADFFDTFQATHNAWLGGFKLKGENAFTDSFINAQDIPAADQCWIKGSSYAGFPCWVSTADGHWRAQRLTGWIGIQASNVPPVNTVTGAIPISTATGEGPSFSNWTNVVPSGDWTIAASGAATLASTTVTPGSYTCVNATFDAKGRATAASSGSCGGGTTLLTGSISLTGGSFDPGACDSNTTTVTGATVGHAVAVSTADGSDVDASGILTATVSASNTVKVQLCPIATHTFTGKSYAISTY